jgi:hypothetical protein
MRLEGLAGDGGVWRRGGGWETRAQSGFASVRGGSETAIKFV